MTQLVHVSSTSGERMVDAMVEAVENLFGNQSSGWRATTYHRVAFNDKDLAVLSFAYYLLSSGQTLIGRLVQVKRISDRSFEITSILDRPAGFRSDFAIYYLKLALQSGRVDRLTNTVALCFKETPVNEKERKNYQGWIDTIGRLLAELLRFLSYTHRLPLLEVQNGTWYEAPLSAIANTLARPSLVVRGHANWFLDFVYEPQDLVGSALVSLANPKEEDEELLDATAWLPEELASRWIARCKLQRAFGTRSIKPNSF